MIWTTDPPTKPGWYQVKNPGSSSRFFRYVTESGHVQDEEDPKCNTLHPRPSIAQYGDRLWSGPIPRPGMAVKTRRKEL